MTVNPHIMKAIAEERIADLRREAAPRSEAKPNAKRKAGSSIRSSGLEPSPPSARSSAESAVPDPRARRTVPATQIVGPTRRKAERRLSAEQLTELVDAAAGGDQRAWNSLIDAFAPMVWSIARAHRLHDADAADVVQATWLALLEHLAELREPDRVGAWLATTARRECLRTIRGTARHILYGDDRPEHESSAPAPGDSLLVSERDAALRRSLSRLRPTDQALLRILMTEPRPAYEEISAALGIPVGSIGPTRGRALARLREQLETEQALALMHD